MPDPIRRVVTGFDEHLGAGDTFVHRGPRHAWVNRSDGPCRLVCTSIAATLPDGVEPG